ncbi:PDR/VanB family oxidoreductase [Chachezhania sediminis]|uniref:PDR/VanB family oxidoreductase n=1 Tax=Chachezhania sediminis TaxID=2599291 RepID=UPI001E31EEA4|nr:PDR/VanB family oxidoreductase [Chachezhania sediminis]
MTLKVRLTVAEADLIRSVVLEAPDGSILPPFTPGAHVEVTIPDGTTRHYSLIDTDGSTAAPKAYRLGIRLEDPGTGGSRFMHDLKEGDTVEVTGPKNEFPLADSDAPSLLIAGGIGVTPMISMATALAGDGRAFTFHYAMRNAGAGAFVDALTGAHGDRVVLHRDDEAGGPLDVAALIDAADPATHIYVCGPKPMIEAVKTAAEHRGFAPDQIHFELFESAAEQDGDTAFEVELASSGKVYTIPAGRTIIEVLEEAGEDLVYDCQRGDCGICQTDVLDGIPDHRDVVLTDAERASNAVMQICVSRAKSPRLKLDL